MKKFIAIASAVAITAGLSIAAASPAEAWYPHNNYNPGVAFGAGVLGFVAGAALANAAGQDRFYHNGYYGGDGWDDHVAACAQTYRSYSARDDAYTTRDTSGRLVRVPCQL